MKTLTKRQKIKHRIRKKVSGTADRPRLVVFRSNSDIYCQLINDESGHTLASASSKDDRVEKGISRVDQAAQVGKIIGEMAKAQNITNAVFDRSGYLYHGRVKALAEGAREGGLSI